MAMLRESYHESLNGVIQDLITMTEDVTTAVEQATKALLEADLTIAEQVISDDAKLDAKHDELENECFQLLARQAPVAGELRTIVAGLRMISDLARMGDLAAHVAKIARLRYPNHAVPSTLEPNFTRMSEVASRMTRQAATVLSDRSVEDAMRLHESDEEMDDLRREQFRIVLGKDWEFGVEAAVDVALLGRYFERIADHAVALGRRMIYLVTGETPQGEDWPTT